MKLLKKIGIGFAVLVVFFLIIGIFAGDDTDPQTTPPSQQEMTEEKESESNVAAEPVETASTTSYTALDFYAAFQENEVIPYTLNEKATQFLTEHDDFFPLNIDNGAEITDDTIDYSIEARQVLKNSDKYGDKLMMLPPTQVVQIQEAAIDDTHYITFLNIADYDGQQYYIIYNEELPEIFDGDFINVIGLPLGSNTFDNVEGGQTWVVILAGCHITGEDFTD